MRLIRPWRPVRGYSNYYDLIGCELGGDLKNIVAIAAGMGDRQDSGSPGFSPPAEDCVNS